MRGRLLPAMTGCLLALALAACATPGVDKDADSDGGPSDGCVAPGRYDMEDGTVQAVGTLEYVDLEGGFWAVTDPSAADGTGIIAVIANSADFAPEIERLASKAVRAMGTSLEGASIRMAGPEIDITSIEGLDDADE